MTKWEEYPQQVRDDIREAAVTQLDRRIGIVEEKIRDCADPRRLEQLARRGDRLMLARDAAKRLP